MARHTKEALESLPEQFRMAVLLADVEGFSYKEIADIMDVPIGTVMRAVSVITHSVPMIADCAPAVSGFNVDGMLSSRSASSTRTVATAWLI